MFAMSNCLNERGLGRKGVGSAPIIVSIRRLGEF
jgi:hypothetical protein